MVEGGDRGSHSSFDLADSESFLNDGEAGDLLLL